MRPVVMLSWRVAGPAGEALVMAEIEIGFGAVIGDEDLAVLIGRHRARIDIEIGVELAQPHLVAARLQHRAERRGSETLAKRGNHAAGDEDVPRHGAQPLTRLLRFDEGTRPLARRISVTHNFEGPVSRPLPLTDHCERGTCGPGGCAAVPCAASWSSTPPPEPPQRRLRCARRGRRGGRAPPVLRIERRLAVIARQDRQHEAGQQKKRRPGLRSRASARWWCRGWS